MRGSTERRKERKEGGGEKKKERQRMYMQINERKKHYGHKTEGLAARNSVMCWIRIPFC